MRGAKSCSIDGNGFTNYGFGRVKCEVDDPVTEALSIGGLSLETCCEH